MQNTLDGASSNAKSPTQQTMDNGANDGKPTAPNQPGTEDASKSPESTDDGTADAFTTDGCLRAERRGGSIKVFKLPGASCACKLDLSDTDIGTAKKLVPMLLAISTLPGDEKK